jgi:hypothetical protein
MQQGGLSVQLTAHRAAPNAARSCTALGRRAPLMREKLADAHDARRLWEAMTEPTRRLARAADIELKHRGVLGLTPGNDPSELPLLVIDARWRD